MKDYQQRRIVNKPANEVYDAITKHIADWWSNDLTGAAAHAGDSFDIAFGNTRKTMEIMEATPNKQVIWKCTKAYIDMKSLENKAEWVGTTMIWTLVTEGGTTTLSFLHKGLNEHLECFTVCESGWNMFITSLQNYLTTGKGSPFIKPTTINFVGA